MWTPITGAVLGGEDLHRAGGAEDAGLAVAGQVVRRLDDLVAALLGDLAGQPDEATSGEEYVTRGTPS
jgi:hypothetical protein